MMSSDGSVYRLDQGACRAQGKLKSSKDFTGDRWHEDVKDFTTLRTAKRRPQSCAARVFEGITNQVLQESADKLRKLHDSEILDLVAKYGPISKRENTKLQKMLLARKQNVLRKVDGLTLYEV